MQQLVRGLLLVLVGLVFFFVIRQDGVGGEITVALIGSGFLAAHALTGEYGFLVPGGIMTGLGLGIAWPGDPGRSTVLLGLGLGFVAIYLVDRLTTYEGGWWPLIPGGVLTFIGLVAARGGITGLLGLWWPLILVGVGIWVAVRGKSVVRATGRPRE